MRYVSLCSMAAFLILAGCTRSTPDAAVKPGFYQPKVVSGIVHRDVSALLASQPLPVGKDYSIIEVGRSQSQSVHVMQVRYLAPHYRSFHETALYVKSGRGSLRMGEKKVDVGPGHVAILPKGTVHALSSLTEEPAVMILVVSPPSDGRDFINVLTTGEGADQRK